MGAYRPAVMGRRGVVASAHSMASLAGLRILMRGGNAIDAAVGVAAALNVTEPYMSGLGGDGVMLITVPGATEPIVLDYCGAVPAAAQASELTDDLTQTGPKAPLIPGAPAGWFAALEQYGTMSLGDVVADAIEYAESGVPVTHKNTEFISGTVDRISDYPLTAETFLSDGAPPRPGSILRQPRLARTYRALASDGLDTFYRGKIGEEIVRSVQDAGGYLTMDDLASFEVEWMAPLGSEFAGMTIYGAPPPTCTIEYLELLRILESEDLLALGHNSAGYIHLLIEAIKLASADRIAYTMNPEFTPQAVLTEEYVAGQRRRINREQAAMGQGDRFGPVDAAAILAGHPANGGSEHTTHFAVADADGFAVNVTQSIGSPFGSAFMAGETGVMLNNFMNWTDIDQSSPNALRPGKKMENCMSPAQIYQDGQFHATIGTPGSWGILQTTPQMILNLLVHGMNMQEAIEAPRFRFMGGKNVVMENRISAEIRDVLTKQGHEIQVVDDLSWAVGGGHGTMRDMETGVLQGGADPRRDGAAMAW